MSERLTGRPVGCSTLSELPPPPPRKTGWPWTEQSEEVPDTMPGGEPWPPISIVTPSYNQGQFIEETIRSVLLQRYPNLEYIIIDGGSTDGSVDIIRKYNRWLAYWISEPDDGQTNAINRGMRMTRGRVVAWLNSDDLYRPGALPQAATALLENPSAALVHGDVWIIDKGGRLLRQSRTHGDRYHLVNWLRGKGIAQQAAFWRRAVFDEVGFLREDLRFIMDYEFFLRVNQKFEIAHVPAYWAAFRTHADAKTTNIQHIRAREHLQVARQYWPTIKDAAEPGYWPQMRRRYGTHLLSHALRAHFLPDSVPKDRQAFLEITEAAFFAPSLLMESWVWRVWLKALLGRRLTRQFRRWRSTLAGCGAEAQG